MKRVFLIVLDSVGAGALPDAAQYGDVGANTLEHTLNAEPTRTCPTLRRWVLVLSLTCPANALQGAVGAVGRAAERSAGKDTTTGHWEMSGVTLS